MMTDTKTDPSDILGLDNSEFDLSEEELIRQSRIADRKIELLGK